MGYQANGFTPEFPWVGDKIVVWDKDTKDIIWEWSTFDYYSMNDYDTISDTWFQAATLGRFDWTHSNALDYDWSLDTNSIEKIYLSVRHLSRISKIFLVTSILGSSCPAEYYTYHLGCSVHQVSI